MPEWALNRCAFSIILKRSVAANTCATFTGFVVDVSTDVGLLLEHHGRQLLDQWETAKTELEGLQVHKLSSHTFLPLSYFSGFLKVHADCWWNERQLLHSRVEVLVIFITIKAWRCSMNVLRTCSNRLWLQGQWRCWEASDFDNGMVLSLELLIWCFLFSLYSLLGCLREV